MKNKPIAGEASPPHRDESARQPPIGPAWRSAHDVYEQDLRRRAVAEKTLNAYRIDTTDLARWAQARGL